MSSPYRHWRRGSPAPSTLGRDSLVFRRRSPSNTFRHWKRWEGRNSNLRRLLFEALELRTLLASDWLNPYIPLDVTADGAVVPVDAIQIINKLNADGSGPLLGLGGEPPPFYYDTSGDMFLAPTDAILVINALNGDHVTPLV